MKKQIIALSTIVIGIIVLSVMPHHSSGKNDKFRRADRPIENQYIVVLNDEDAFKPVESEEAADRLTVNYGGRVKRVFNHAMKGFSAEMSEQEAENLSRDENVKYVEEDGEIETSTTQVGATWGLDRIDQHVGPFDGNYIYTSAGNNVHVYIIDTGIRATHAEFGGRAVLSFDAIGDGQNGNDCNGHGTHVAGTVGGSNYGVAKNVTLHAVRVLNCSGSGATSGVVAGVDWVTQNHAGQSVANMSLGGSLSTTLTTAITNSIAAGVTYVVAAGNGNQDACNSSPANVPNAITVGATTSLDERAYFSNFGTCVDIFAPGVSITSAWNTDDVSTNMISGTSMASPHVAGVAALYLQDNPTAAPAAVTAAITGAATPGLVVNAGTNSPNLLLFSQLGGGSGVCGGTNFAGSLGSSGASNFHTSAEGFNAGSGLYKAVLNLPSGSQFGVRLEKKKGRKWNIVASSSRTGSTETVDYNGSSGTYRWSVYSTTGSGSYSLCAVNP